jgi:hypothetical protein
MRHLPITAGDELTGLLAFHSFCAGIVVSSLAQPVFHLVLAYDAIQGRLFQPGASLCDNVLLCIPLLSSWAATPSTLCSAR